MSKCESSFSVCRVSSQAITSASFRTRKARSVMSSRFPIGVATTYRHPAVTIAHFCLRHRIAFSLIELAISIAMLQVYHTVSHSFGHAHHNAGPRHAIFLYSLCDERSLALPLYEYRCVKCGHRFEKIESVSASDSKKCPKCGAKAERQLSAPAIQFKGSGWYVTDYAGKKPDGVLR